ncbi:LacI family DNA-binding transcriptional regulator [Candidatus Soleaferrea massiliensis]|uniref:LacI family DNA-binding transcriptional regulator n=1 Tax=Candidatus Soleaferrea massiliensis TaxID=1470354 RepID=UPI00058BD86E|nr:LacI family DNA-binding transcriptional regulator [Candidatus Soleaferrea massiliensis]
MKTLTMKDIANLAGVGLTTVSRVINNEPYVNEHTRQRVMEVINKYNYIPNNSARNLKRTRSNTIGVLVKGITNPFFSRMIKVIESEITKHDYTMTLHQVDINDDEIANAISLVNEKRLAGLIFLGGNFSHSQDRFLQLKVPFVLTTIMVDSDKVDKDVFSSVSINDTKESFDAVNYLCRLGHRKIAIIAASQNDTSIGRLRLDGYRLALVRNGIDFDENLLEHGEFTLESGYIAMNRLLDRCEGITCVYAISDFLALGASRAILERGLRIPEDISVMGFDGIDLGEYSTPSITTIAQPGEEMALQSVKILFDLIYKKNTNQHVIFKAKLIERESCREVQQASVQTN